MAFTQDVSSWRRLSTANPRTLNHTCGSNAKLLVLNIFIAGVTARTGADPTYGGIPFTKIDSYASGETGNEMWYLVNPSSGTYQISVGNNGALSIALTAISFNASTGAIITLDASSRRSATTANPSTNITTNYPNEVIVQHWSSGLNTITGTPTGVKIVLCDVGKYGTASQYLLTTDATTYSVGWSGVATSDDYILINAAFREYIPLSITPVFKYWDGTQWVEAKAGSIKYWDGASWQVVKAGAMKVYIDGEWKIVQFNG